MLPLYQLVNKQQSSEGSSTFIQGHADHDPKGEGNTILRNVRNCLHVTWHNFPKDLKL